MFSNNVVWMWLNICRRNVKYDRFVAIRCVFSSSKYSKTRFRPGPAAPPGPLVGWGGGHTLPIPFPLDAFGVSISAPSAPRLSGPNTNSWLRLCIFPGTFFGPSLRLPVTDWTRKIIIGNYFRSIPNSVKNVPQRQRLSSSDGRTERRHIQPHNRALRSIAR